MFGSYLCILENYQENPTTYSGEIILAFAWDKGPFFRVQKRILFSAVKKELGSLSEKEAKIHYNVYTRSFYVILKYLAMLFYSLRGPVSSSYKRFHSCKFYVPGNIYTYNTLDVKSFFKFWL